jgi:hypothetical protein
MTEMRDESHHYEHILWFQWPCPDALLDTFIFFGPLPSPLSTLTQSHYVQYAVPRASLLSIWSLHLARASHDGAHVSCLVSHVS